jgi:hypothetical protein
MHVNLGHCSQQCLINHLPAVSGGNFVECVNLFLIGKIIYELSEAPCALISDICAMKRTNDFCV